MDAALFVIALTLIAQAGWSPDRYQTSPPAAAPTSDRYQTAPAAVTNGVSPPPSITDRARNAATETGNTLREGLEAGVQAANQQFSQGTQQFYENTRAAGDEFTQEFQNWAGTTAQEFVPINTAPRATAGQTTNTRGQLSNPFAPVAPAQPTTTKSRNGFAPPPWAGATPTTEPDWGTAPPAAAPGNFERTAALGAGPVRTDSGWTSVNSDLAPPALLIPRLVNTRASAASSQQAASGPSFPSGVGSQPQADRSVVVQNQPQTPASSNADDGWALGWGNNTAQPVTIGRYDNPPASNNNQPAQGSVQAETVAAHPQNPQNGQQSTQRSDQKSQFDPWSDNDPWANSVKSPQGTPQATSGGTIAQSPASTPSPQGTAGQASLPPAGTAATPATAAGTLNPPANSVAQPTASNLGNAPPTAPTGNEPPWVPLLVVSLSLAGSVGANLFLGWSYIDARQKYRSLVQKTANTFRRVSAVA